MSLFNRKKKIKQDNKAQYIADNQQFIQDMATLPGIIDLGEGVLMKQIADDNPDGKQPKVDSVVTFHYSGRLINERIFDTSIGLTPPAMRVSDMIPGMQRALTSMHVGQQCRVYIPAEQGYGMQSMSRIPSGSTLIFDITLIAVN